MQGKAGFTALLVLVGIAAGGFGFYLSGGASSTDTPPLESASNPALSATAGPVLGQLRPAFTLPDTAGKPRRIEEWDGQIVVLNFWATWCVPCREEIPMLVALQQDLADRGVSIVGIAVDSPDNVAKFEHDFGMNYPSLLAAKEVIELGKRYGNGVGALPYTVVIGRDKIIKFTRLGQVDRAGMDEAINPLL